MGDVGAHRLVRYTAKLRAYNNTKSMVLATLAPKKRLHIFYQYPDNRGKQMWATRAYVNGKFLRGFIYPDRVNWHATW